MLDSKDLVKNMKKAAMEAVKSSKPVDVLYGVVRNISPLEIFVDQKFVLTKEFLMIPEYLTDYQTEISFDDPSIKQVYTTWNMAETQESDEAKIAFKSPIKHKITVYNALKAGDKVILLRQQGGQRFLVMDRAVTA